MNVLEVEDLRTYYRTSRGFIRAVDGVFLTVKHGIILGIVGESGCGKSTLGKSLMMNINPPLEYIGGKVILAGFGDLSGLGKAKIKTEIWGKRISYIPQSALNALVPTYKIGKFIRDVIRYHLRVDSKNACALATERLRELNLPTEVLGKYPHELSGGMRQRVTIAVATLLNPQILIADEPTSALDVSTQKQVLLMFLRLRKEGFVKSICYITHDIATLRQVADEIAVMYGGKIVENGPADAILCDPLHPYTKGLLDAVVTPDPDTKRKGLSYIKGEPPDLLSPPQGCRFHPRCGSAVEICWQEEPPRILVDEERLVNCHLWGKR